ncbi:MAG: hypothetical protein FJ318_01415 [SAR202 cluster bacterium]|nr:hypothetical protein [SAR202 cluster bacterium]
MNGAAKARSKGGTHATAHCPLRDFGEGFEKAGPVLFIRVRLEDRRQQSDALRGDRRQAGADFGIDGGIFQTGAPQDPTGPGLRIYANVDDADAYAAKIVKAGGTEVMKPGEVPGMGIKIGLFKDPGGNMIGVVQTIGLMPPR